MGQAKRITIDKDNTTIIEGAGKKSDLQARIAQIRKQVEETTSDYDREKLQERLAKLSGGVAVVNVGAATEAEMNEKKARVEDALNATRAAVEEGIVPGGGVACLRAIPAVAESRKKLKGEEKVGASLLAQALEIPIRTIAENSGADGAVVASEVIEKPLNVGYDANVGEYADMLKTGIIDPAKVTRIALENAVSIAGLLLTTEIMVTELKEEEEDEKIEGAVR